MTSEGTDTIRPKITIHDKMIRFSVADASRQDVDLTASYEIALGYDTDLNPGVGHERESKVHKLNLVLNPRKCNQPNAELAMDRNACVCAKGYYGSWGSTCTKCAGATWTTLSNGKKFKTDCIDGACPKDSSTMLFCEYENSNKTVGNVTKVRCFRPKYLPVNTCSSAKLGSRPTLGMCPSLPVPGFIPRVMPQAPFLLPCSNLYLYAPFTAPSARPSCFPQVCSRIKQGTCNSTCTACPDAPSTTPNYDMYCTADDIPDSLPYPAAMPSSKGSTSTAPSKGRCTYRTVETTAPSPAAETTTPTPMTTPISSCTVDNSRYFGIACVCKANYYGDGTALCTQVCFPRSSGLSDVRGFSSRHDAPARGMHVPP